MEELNNRLRQLLTDRLYQMIISSPRKKGAVSKVKIRPVMLKGRLCFQETVSRGTQVFHGNYEADKMRERILAYMEQDFRQLEAESMDGRLTVLVSKKGTATVKWKKADRQGSAMPIMTHNRRKRYILQEQEAVPFLVDLGVQTAEGKIVHAKYDKFKQINRYLEFVEDILPKLNTGKTIHILDFGCGKSYLTFALYYYLHELKGLDVSITGMDLKADVIEKCNQLAACYGYEKLHFLQGDIGGYEKEEAVDMVVTLHACDTATDYAIAKAIAWKAEVLFAVPCCQHEANRQMENELWEPVLKYGILKERMAALLTDGIRANLLEEAGYDTQVLEFIETEHTPKNLLIRAVRRKDAEAAQALRAREGALGSSRAGEIRIQRLAQKMHVELTLQRLLNEEGVASGRRRL